MRPVEEYMRSGLLIGICAFGWPVTILLPAGVPENTSIYTSPIPGAADVMA